MDLAYISFRQILTMVILMLVGLLCAKIGLVDRDTVKKLSNLVLYLVFPLIILLSYQRPFEIELLWGLLLSLLLSVVVFVIAFAVTYLVYKNRGGKDFAIERFACIYPNSGFLGIPLIYGIFGTEGVFYLTGYLTIFFMLIFTHGMMSMGGERDFGAVKRVLISPPILSIVLGFGLFVLGIRLPGVILAPAQLLADLNTPLAMLVAGASIYGVGAVKTIRDRRIYAICAVRLLLIPGLTMLVLAPFQLPGVLLGTIIVVAACPAAAILVLAAHRYERDHVYASQVFAATTILSMGTIPLLLLFH